jgi:hypothetical protein
LFLAYEDYTIHKQTYLELEEKYDRSEKTIRKYFDTFCGKISLNNSKQVAVNLDFEVKGKLENDSKKLVNIVMDTTFFGRDFGVMVFRAEHKNLAWRYVNSEKLIYYLEELYKLTELNYVFKSFTIDGRKGLIKLLKINF